jgi:hypothetical protein
VTRAAETLSRTRGWLSGDIPIERGGFTFCATITT